MSSGKSIESQRVRVRRSRDRQHLVGDYAKRLREDPRAKSAFKKLKQLGAPDSVVNYLIGQFEAIPTLWYCEVRETKSDRGARHRLLGRQLHRAAELIRGDPDVRRLTLFDIQHGLSDRSTSGVPDKASPTLADSLTWTASTLLDKPGFAFAGPDAASRRVSLERYAIRYVFAHLSQFPLGQRPMSITAQIVSALLNRDVPANRFAKDRELDLMRPRKRYTKE